MIIKYDRCMYHNPCFYPTYLAFKYSTGEIFTVKWMDDIERYKEWIKFTAVINHLSALMRLKKKKQTNKQHAKIALHFDKLDSTDKL